MTELAQWVTDALISASVKDESGDFILRVDEPDQIVYVSPENGAVYLITVREAKFYTTSKAPE